MLALLYRAHLRLSTRQVAAELKRLGLRWRQLPPELRPRLAELWTAHSGKGVGAAAAAIAQELPGGWSDQQVRDVINH